MIEPQSIADLLKAPILEVPKGKRPVRILACGTAQDVNSVIQQLHAIGFAKVIAWTPPVPSLGGVLSTNPSFVKSIVCRGTA